MRSADESGAIYAVSCKLYVRRSSDPVSSIIAFLLTFGGILPLAGHGLFHEVLATEFDWAFDLSPVSLRGRGRISIGMAGTTLPSVPEYRSDCRAE